MSPTFFQCDRQNMEIRFQIRLASLEYSLRMHTKKGKDSFSSGRVVWICCKWIVFMNKQLDDAKWFCNESLDLVFKRTNILRKNQGLVQQNNSWTQKHCDTVLESVTTCYILYQSNDISSVKIANYSFFNYIQKIEQEL